MKQVTIAILLLVTNRQTFAQNYIAVDPELRYQTIEGLGGTFLVGQQGWRRGQHFTG